MIPMMMAMLINITILYENKLQKELYLHEFHSEIIHGP